MKKSEFDRRLNIYINHINDNFEQDSIAGNFYLVHAFWNSKRMSFNRLSFYEHYSLTQVHEYCEKILPLLWQLEYCFLYKLQVVVYHCYLNPQTSEVTYKKFGEGYYEESTFIYKQL